MNCPKCGKEMLRGSMHTQKYPFWTQQELRFFKAPTDLVELGPLPDAEICQECGLVVFPCKMIEKKAKK